MALGYMSPDGTTTSAGSAVGAGTHHECTDDPITAPNEDVDYVNFTTALSSTDTLRLSLASFVAEVVTIVSVRVYGRIRRVSGAAAVNIILGVRIGSTDYLGSAQGYGDTYATYGGNTLTTNPATSVAWTKADLQGLIAVVQNQNTSPSVGANDNLTQVYVEVDFVGAPAKLEQAREVASRELRLTRIPVAVVEAKLPLYYMRIPLLTPVSLVGREGVAPSEEE